MKPIYECLDHLLNHLHQNRFKPEGQRAPFDVTGIMGELELTSTHEFEGLVDMLIEAKYAFSLDPLNNLDVYKTRVMITPRGIDFKSKGGYQTAHSLEISRGNKVTSLENELKVNRDTTLFLTAILMIGTLLQALIAFAALLFQMGYFRFGLR